MNLDSPFLIHLTLFIEHIPKSDPQHSYPPIIINSSCCYNFHQLTSYAPPHPLNTSNLSLFQGDVLILADALEEFRTICMKPSKHEIDPSSRFDIKPQLLVTEEGNYELDAAHYVSAPQLTWDAMLKQTGVHLELISDTEIYRMLANSMRGAIYIISGRYSKANNKYMGTLRSQETQNLLQQP